MTTDESLRGKSCYYNLTLWDAFDITNMGILIVKHCIVTIGSVIVIVYLDSLRLLNNGTVVGGEKKVRKKYYKAVCSIANAIQVTILFILVGQIDKF